MDMEKEVYGYIYKIRNTVNEKVYIGLTTNGFDKRYSRHGEGIERVYNYHASRKRREEPYNKHLLNSIEKHGFEAFEIIKEFDIAYSEEELKEKEKYWISYYKCNDRNYGYNRTEGGDSCSKGEDNPKYKERTTVKCDYCGKEVKKLESYVNKVSNTFCSEECLGKWQREQRKGKDSSRYIGFVVIYPDGEVSKEMTRDEVVNYLGVSRTIIETLVKEKTCYIGRYEHIKHVRVLHLEDYLEERELYKSDEDFRNMCKRKVEEAEILYKIKKEEFREACKQRTGKNSPGYGKGEKIRGAKNVNAKLLVCIFPDGRIIKGMCVIELAKELGIGTDTIRSILRSHKSYKPNKKRLKKLEGIIIMTQEDYLNTLKNQNTNINDDKAS